MSADDYEVKVRSSYRSMSEDELIERKRQGGLTSDALVWLDQELMSRGISDERQIQISEEIDEWKKSSFNLPAGISEKDLASPRVRLVANIIDYVAAFLGVVLAIQPYPGSLHVLLGFAFYVFYYLLSDALPNGMSIGKRIFGIQVVDDHSLQPCSLKQAFKRNLLLAVPVIGWLDAASIFNPLNRRLGDRWANTLVIKRSRS